MKTAKELVRLVLSRAEIELSELEECCPEHVKDMVEEVTNYSKELVKAVLEAVKNNITLIRYFEEWKDGELVLDDSTEEANYKSPYLGNGSVITINDNSIFSAYPETLIV